MRDEVNKLPEDMRDEVNNEAKGQVWEESDR